MGFVPGELSIMCVFFLINKVYAETSFSISNLYEQFLSTVTKIHMLSYPHNMFTLSIHVLSKFTTSGEEKWTYGYESSFS